MEYELPAGHVCLLTDDGTDLTLRTLQKLEQRGWPVVVIRFPQQVVERGQALPEGTRTLQLVDLSEEHLVSSLNEQIKKQEVTIKEFQGAISLSLVDRILFRLGEATLTPQGEKILAKVGEGLKKVQGKMFRVVGHTDTIPIREDFRDKFPSNWELSAARAINVTRYLSDEGIAPEILSAVAYGEYKPVADNGTEEGRQKNRRIAIILLPKD